MSGEGDFIALMRTLATHPGARGLMDDAAVLDHGGQALVLTHDMIVEGVHYLPGDPPECVAWKLVAVNMSDLAAKGAMPLGVLLGASLSGDAAWERRFAQGLGEALDHFGAPLLGGDTVTAPPGGAGALGMTAIGSAAPSGVPARSGARPGDTLLASGTIGDSGAGLALIQAGQDQTGEDAAMLARAYRRPMPDIGLGRELAPLVSAMADISDGLLIDAGRIAEASGCRVTIDLDAIPLSRAFAGARGDSRESRLFAATAGDDYRLLFAVRSAHNDQIAALGKRLDIPLTPVGRCEEGTGLALVHEGRPVPLPPRLGYEHGAFRP